MGHRVSSLKLQKVIFSHSPLVAMKMILVWLISVFRYKSVSFYTTSRTTAEHLHKGYSIFALLQNVGYIYIYLIEL